MKKHFVCSNARMCNTSYSIKCPNNVKYDFIYLPTKLFLRVFAKMVKGWFYIQKFVLKNSCLCILFIVLFNKSIRIRRYLTVFSFNFVFLYPFSWQSRHLNTTLRNVDSTHICRSFYIISWARRPLVLPVLLIPLVLMAANS